MFYQCPAEVMLHRQALEIEACCIDNVCVCLFLATIKSNLGKQRIYT